MFRHDGSLQNNTSSLSAILPNGIKDLKENYRKRNPTQIYWAAAAFSVKPWIYSFFIFRDDFYFYSHCHEDCLTYLLCLKIQFMLALNGSDKNVKVVAIQACLHLKDISKIFSKRFPMGHFQILVSTSMPAVLSKSAVYTILDSSLLHVVTRFSRAVTVGSICLSFCQNVMEAYYLDFLKLLFLCNFCSFHIYGAPKYNHAK